MATPRRLYNLDKDKICAQVETSGYTYTIRGRTILVRNASGKRAHGEIYPCRDGGWEHRLDGNAVRIWEELAAIGSLTTPASGSLEQQALRDAVKVGNARSLGYSDEQIAEAVRYGVVSQSDAMNQDD